LRRYNKGERNDKKDRSGHGHGHGTTTNAALPAAAADFAAALSSAAADSVAAALPPAAAAGEAERAAVAGAYTRSRLNLSALNAIGGARRDCVARVQGVLGGVQGVLGVFICQTRHKLS
jgi:hypothetical protein